MSRHVKSSQVKSSQVPAHGIWFVSAAQDHMKSMQAIVGFDSTRLSSPTTQTQLGPNAVANRTGRPLIESNGRGTRLGWIDRSCTVRQFSILGNDESRRNTWRRNHH